MSSTIAEFNTHSCYPIYGDPVDFTCDYTMHNLMMNGYSKHPVERDEDRFFINMFMVVHIVFFSVFISSMFVATFVWYPMVKDGEQAALEEEEANKHKPVPVIAYEKKYPLDSNNVNRSEMLDASGNFVGDTLEHHKQLINSLILENVPDHGSALFRYNSDKNGFEYWANRHIPHRYLRAIARKYVNTYKCYELYVDEETAEEKKEREEREEAEKAEQAETDSVSVSEKEQTTQPITLLFVFKDFCSWFIDFTFQHEGVSRKHPDYPMIFKIVKYMIMDENWVPCDDDDEEEEEDAEEAEQEEAEEEEAEEEEAEEEEAEEEEESVFATFKNYKMSSKNKLNSKKGVENNKEKENKTNDIVDKEINKFVYVGLLNTFDFIRVKDSSGSSSSDDDSYEKVLTFDDFKKKFLG